MAIYNNLRKESPLTAVEFSPVSDGNFSFFYVDSPVKKDLVKQWLKSAEVGQEIIAETQVEGRPVLVTHGDKTKDEIMKLLADKGDKLELSHPKKPTNLWAFRSAMSVGGQTLQMLSAWRQLRPNQSGELVRSGIDVPTMMFAVLNMTANIMGFVFGSQKTEDEHHLAHLKEEFNNKLDTNVTDGQSLPAVDEKRKQLRMEPQPPKGYGQKVWDFLQRNSVTVGEIGLRFAAAIALTFPIKTMGPAFAKLREGNIAEAISIGRNKDHLKFYAGLGYLVGKTIALFTKVKDPYDPKPHTWLDTIREDVLFKAGSLIEAGAGSAIAINGFTHGKIDIGGKQMPDYAGGVGGLMFATGYLIRFFAKFGEKQMNMEELHAHISDSLSKVPPDKLPQLMADCAASIKDHFKDKPLEFGKIYSQIMTDMYRYHHIALDNLGTEPEERIAKMNKLTCTDPKDAVCNKELEAAKVAEAKTVNAEDPVLKAKRVLKNHPRKTVADIASVTPATSHVEKAAQSTGEIQAGLSA